MDVNFQYSDAPAIEPIVFEQVFGEKPGGGIVANPSYDLPAGTAVGFDSEGVLKPIKCYKLVKAVADDDTTIEIEKGSGVAVGDIIANGKIGAACTAVDTTNAAKDVVTVTMGIAIANGTKLYQSSVESAEATTEPEAAAVDATPLYVPFYLTGAKVYAGKGDQAVKLVNGANVRKETVNAANEVLAIMKNIEKV